MLPVAFSLAAIAEEKATLSFAWPAQFRAQVTATVTRTSRLVEMNRERTESVSGTFAMHGDKRADGEIYLRSDNMGVTMATGRAAEATLTILELVPLLPLVFEPTWVVAEDGSFLRIEGAQEFRSTVETLVLTYIDDAADRESFRKFVPQLLEQDASDDRLLELAVMRWAGIVAAWKDRTLIQGETSRWTQSAELAAPGNPVLPYHYEQRLVGRVPCMAGDTEKRCVELNMITEVDAADLSVLADAVEQSRTNPEINKMRVEYPEMRIETIVVTDPATLLPYRYRQTTRQAMKMVDGQSTMETRTQDELEMTFVY